MEILKWFLNNFFPFLQGKLYYRCSNIWLYKHFLGCEIDFQLYIKLLIFLLVESKSPKRLVT